ncbi:hypothetical protein GWK36_07420 [Caldichromatium japonicum]|uniref:Transmembrane protein (PGPGW) n=1 Tax=Caldichromatium japonicum TaxID=2699430 RepID=A0A6G7VCQ6_9GAMM|nr:PGPGW domain-containing protein [Caldichromatium japonicum]QIK37839.1 hypothetical protein GWK36_07420 [Caldichromatium japonicum]
MIDALWTWIGTHESLLLALVGLSALILIASLLTLPFAIAAIPEDYFAADRRSSGFRAGHPLASIGLRLIKNALGWLLILAGLAMLVLPGQGILTLFVGLILSDFPGKHALERRLAADPRILAALNWLRQRAGRAPFRVPSPSGDRD